jgi:hypothetical protein
VYVKCEFSTKCLLLVEENMKLTYPMKFGPLLIQNNFMGALTMKFTLCLHYEIYHILSWLY